MQLSNIQKYLSKYRLAISLVAIFIVALTLRIIMVNDTVVINPLRADAGEYYLYSVNLKQYGVYSLADNILHDEKKHQTPQPDANRTPGYSLFIYPFVDFPPTKDMFDHVLLLQAFLSALTVLIAFMFFQSFLAWWGALLAAGMVALSPHLVAANIYVLTETLFTFFLVSLIYSLANLQKKQDISWSISTGILLGCTMLVKPTLSYFLLLLIPTLFILFPLKKTIRIAVLIFISCYVVYGPWLIRNVISVPETAKSTKAMDSIHKGMYPNIMFRDDPKTFGYPNRADPDWIKRRDMKSVIGEISRRFSEEPLRYLHWYLIGKPIVFLSWNMVVGMGDIFVYPVQTSPYHTSKIFYFTHRLMYWLHWPLMLLALFALIITCTPYASRYMSDSQVTVARISSLVILYFLAIHVVGLPLPRYAIPIRPVMYGMAMLGVSILVSLFRNRREQRIQDSG